jgi:hypothetical protein
MTLTNAITQWGETVRQWRRADRKAGQTAPPGTKYRAVDYPNV